MVDDPNGTVEISAGERTQVIDKAASPVSGDESAKEGKRDDADAEKQREDKPRKKDRKRRDHDDEPRKPRDQDEEPRKPRREMPWKNWKFSRKQLIAIGAGGGGFVLLMLFAAFVWPGFLLAAPIPYLRYVPADTWKITGVNFSVFDRTPYKAVIRGIFNLEEEGREFVADADYLVLADGSPQSARIVHKEKNFDLDKLRRNLHFAPAETFKGKTIYRHYKDARDEKQFLFVPQSRLVVIEELTEPQFVRMLETSTPQLRAGMEERIRKVRGDGVWGVIDMDTLSAKRMRQDLWQDLSPPRGKQAKFDMEKGLTESGGEEDPSIKDGKAALKKARFVTFTANPHPDRDGKDMKIEARIECADDADAGKVEKAFAAKTNEFHTYLSRSILGQFGNVMAEDIKSSLKINSAGSVVIVAIVLTKEKTFDDLEKGMKELEKRRLEQDL